MRPTRGMTPAKRQKSQESSLDSDSGTGEKVAVYCRVRGPPLTEEEPCVRLESEKVVVLTPPETSRSYRGGQVKEMHHTFTKAFSDTSTQKAVFNDVGRPLVKELVSGWSSLLFMYGVTGSGKTHTMQGTPEDGGIMARSIEVLFKSLGNNLTAKYQIVRDPYGGFNGFKFQSKEEAKQQELIELRKTRKRNDRLYPNLTSDDDSIIDDVDTDAIYTIFVSYVEVYNEKIYDLLDSDTKTKDLRQDPTSGWQFVNECVEVQVTSAQEAMEVFHQGQKRRRVAHTTLNAQSSRSHSVFNIRLVKAQSFSDGEINDEAPMEISQLSLVDMAGSERTSRTGNTGDKLKEGGRINNSLSTLKRCIQCLRENQKLDRLKKPLQRVPCRDSKITMMFENFFYCKPGCGSLRMMVCVNPQPADYDENIHVMAFAEMTQKVEIERVDPIPKTLFTPGQAKGNEAYREALRRVNINTPSVANPVYSPIYNLGPEWPSLEIQQCDDEDTLDVLERYLTKRITTRNSLVEDHNSQIEALRARLVDAEKELIVLREENTRLKGGSDGERRRIQDLEKRLVNAENANTSLQRKNAALVDAKTVLEKELDDKELEINANKKEQIRSRRKLQTQLSQEKQINNELALRLQDEEHEKNKNVYDKAKLRAVRKIVNDDNGKLLNKTVSDPDVSSMERVTPWKRKPLTSARSNQDVGSTPVPTPRRSIAISNPRYRRSRSAGQVWIDHQPKTPVVTNTIMQPSNLKKRRSVTKVNEKDFADPKCSNYALTHQEQDTDGDLETKIYKGDIIPTKCGGAQIVFNDVEIHKQKSPEKSPSRPMTRRSKRSYEEAQEVPASVGSRVAAFENKMSGKKHRFR